MNQSDFRSLLASTSSSSSSSTPKSRFGLPPPKRSAGTDTTEFKKPEFKPRDKGKGKSGSAGGGGGKKKKEGEGDEDAGGSAYRDRAAERRVGKPNDYSGVEKLLEDFQARSEGVEDKSLLEEQMKYLGGDAEHSVLVKGLDFALLEREREKLNLVSDQSMEEVEAALDEKLRAEMKDKKRNAEGGGKKKSRDEILRELKESREGSGVGGVEGKEREELNSKFKPIGFKPIGGGKDGEKRKKKKKTKDPAAATATIPPSTSISSTSAQPLSSSTKSSTAPLSVPQAKPVLDSDGEEDIFGGVGEYEGLGDDSDSDDESKPQKVSAPIAPTASTSTSTAPHVKRRYFDDNEEDAGPIGSTAPSSVTNLQRGGTEGRSRTAGEEGEDDGEGREEAEGITMMRLQPLSGSAVPSVRDLLDMDKAQEKEEKRKAKKLKYQAKQGEKQEKEMTEADKANKDYQTMQNFLAKREKKGKEKGGDEGEEK